MKENRFTGYNPNLTKNARALRKNLTRQERRLWFDFLRYYPVKFYRQRVIDRYIADFYCSKAKLVVELDGGQHYTEDGMASDNIRTEILGQYGLEVLRIANSDIDRNFTSVCEEIDRIVKERIYEQKNC